MVRDRGVLALVSSVAIALAGCGTGGGGGGGTASGARLVGGTANGTGGTGGAGGTGGGGAPATPRTFPDTTATIGILVDQLPGSMTPAQLQFAASHFVGSQKLLVPVTQSLRALNPGFIVLHYHLAMWQSAASVPFVLDGRTWSNDYPLVTQHEPWFWHDAAGSRIPSPNDGKLLMNVADAGFQAYWSSSLVAQTQAGGYDGVFLDSASPAILQGEIGRLEPRLAGTAAHDTSFAELGGKTWIGAWQTWIGGLDAALAAQGLVLIPNVGQLTTFWDTTTYAVSGGQFSEGFGDPAFSEREWKSAADQLIAFANAGKVVILQNYLGGNPNDLARRRYYLGTYLLVKASRTYLDYFASAPLEWYPEWALDLGAPLTSARAGVADLASSGLYRRDFQRGVVLVNPTAADVTVTLGATFRRVEPQGGGPVDASGATPGTLGTTSVTQIVVASKGAEILLR